MIDVPRSLPLSRGFSAAPTRDGSFIAYGELNDRHSVLTSTTLQGNSVSRELIRGNAPLTDHHTAPRTDQIASAPVADKLCCWMLFAANMIHFRRPSLNDLLLFTPSSQLFVFTSQPPSTHVRKICTQNISDITRIFFSGEKFCCALKCVAEQHCRILLCPLH